MKKIISIKNLLFLLFIQLSFGALALAINTEKIDAQSSALIKAAGLEGGSDLATIFTTIILVVLGFLGIIFLFLTLQSGFKWMTSQGNEKTVEEAKGSLKNAVIGLFIVLAAYAITTAVFNYMPFNKGGGTNASGPAK